MLKERARIYYQEKDYNCAEAIIRAANDEYALGINEAGLKAFGGFGSAFCAKVRKENSNPVEHCWRVVEGAVEILEKIME